MSFVCSEYVEQCSFVWAVSRLCRYTIGYVIGVFEIQDITLVVAVPVLLCWFQRSGYVSFPCLYALCCLLCSVFLPNVYLLS